MDSAVRADALNEAVLARFEQDIRAALRRRTTSEARLAGALRTLATASPGICAQQAELATVLVRRSGYERQLYASAIRSVAESGHERAGTLLGAALSSEAGGGLATISAACFNHDPGVASMLARLAVGRQTHVAFAVEVARLVRGESGGARLLELAPKIKESHRIALCLELFVPLARGRVGLPASIAPALAILRDAERHLGRWLVLAEVARRAGDARALADARQRATMGTDSARAAWSLVTWALEPETAPPPIRPTADLVARLSDRPSADRDLMFLFRMALARVPSARPMLEGFVKVFPFSDEVAVRAAMHLALDYGRDDLVPRLIETATDDKRPDLRGVAAAALWDLGQTMHAARASIQLVSARSISSVAWGALVRAAQRGYFSHSSLLCEPTFRRMQYGWVE